jgi:SAM-dependent methyltransferase
MTPASQLAQYALGIQGLALLRLWLTGDSATVRTRLEEMRALVRDMDEPPLADPILGVEYDLATGYAHWAPTYDRPNPAITREERAVRPLLDEAPVGRALDAACGTGRHARYLAARGHTVIGIDASPAMLAQARQAVPGVEFRPGRLDALPLPDVAVCSLALTHCPDLVAPLRELARVVQPGGQVILSDIHPLIVYPTCRVETLAAG